MSVYQVIAEVMLSGGTTVVLNRQGLLNYLTNFNYAEPVVTPHWVYSSTNEFVTTTRLD